MKPQFTNLPNHHQCTTTREKGGKRGGKEFETCKTALVMNAQYFSKYRNSWVDFHADPTPGQIIEMKKYHYKIRINGIEQ